MKELTKAFETAFMLAVTFGFLWFLRRGKRFLFENLINDKFYCAKEMFKRLKAQSVFYEDLVEIINYFGGLDVFVERIEVSQEELLEKILNSPSVANAIKYAGCDEENIDYFNNLLFSWIYNWRFQWEVIKLIRKHAPELDSKLNRRATKKFEKPKPDYFSTKNIIIGLLIINLFIALMFLEFDQKSREGTLFNSVDGKLYKTIKIDDQKWLAENLKSDVFRNGDSIPYVRTKEEWIAAAKNKTPACAYYGYDSSIGGIYGKLYNWYAVKDPRGLAPAGWRIPSDKDWIPFLGDENAKNNASSLKSNNGWNLDKNGHNSTGFTALPGGIINEKGISVGEKINGSWWSSTEINPETVLCPYLFFLNDAIYRDTAMKGFGLSVRCIKESPKNK